jgi:hypothetical protein
MSDKNLGLLLTSSPLVLYCADCLSTQCGVAQGLTAGAESILYKVRVHILLDVKTLSHPLMSAR